MKNLFKILAIVLIAGCSSQTEKTTEQNSDSTKKSVMNYVDLPEKYVGFWVYESYFEALQKTKSTKKAGEMDVDDFYRISKDNSIMRMNIHEGGADNIILMTSKSDGQIFSSDTTDTYYKVEFRDEFMIVDGKKYIKAPNNENGFNELVNSAFISGIYLLNGSEIEFKTNGVITGLDSIQNFELNLDYNDAGMQYDKIYLQFNNEKETRTYLYGFNSDTLIISNIDCKTQAEDYDYCLEVEKGETIYKLIKK
jgi:hypothetical protein